MEMEERQKPECAVITMPDHPHWSEAECIDIFWRLLIMGWLDPGRMSVAMARDYGTKLGHYGNLALAKQERHQQRVLAERMRSHV